MDCPKCGYKNSADSEFCQSCGSPLNAAGGKQTRQPGNKPLIITIIITAAILFIIMFAIIAVLAGGRHAEKTAEASPVPINPSPTVMTSAADPGNPNKGDMESAYESGDTTTKYTMYVVNCKEWISLRYEPSADSDKIATIPLGESCGFIEKSVNGFYKIAYNGKVGYALAQYLSTEKPYIESPSAQILYVVNCNESITLRPSDNVNSGEITQIPLGASVEYLGQAGNGFYKVRYNGTVGYALAQYLSGTKQVQNPPQTKTMKVVNCNESITLRPSDNVNSGEITQIPLGATVEYLGQAGNGFYKVRYNGTIGYALSQYLK